MNTVSSPIDGRPLHTWQESGAAVVGSAVEAARRAGEELRRLGRWGRADLLVTTGERLRARADAVADDLVTEHGKTRTEAGAEVAEAIAAFTMNAETARRLEGSLPETSDPRKRVLVQRIPIGVVGVITPWNFPVNIPVEYLGPALAMGNAVVWKPAESTARSSRHLAEVFAEAGWPDGALTCLEGGPLTGSALARHPGLAAIGFTGSSVVGHEIAAVGGIRTLLLELGGNGPTVVLAGADVERAAERVVAGAAFCSGQSCSATELVLVEASIADELAEAVAASAAGHRVGDPFDDGTSFGPLHLQQTADTMARHVADAVSRGGRLLSGGAPEADRPTGRYWPLTAISGVPADALAATEETFGPIVPISPFGDDAELAALLDGSRYGLSGAVFAGDLSRAWRIADDLPCGIVVVNDNSNVWETHLPFGGHPGRASGTGRVGGRYAMESLSTVKSIVIDTGER